MFLPCGLSFFFSFPHFVDFKIFLDVFLFFFLRVLIVLFVSGVTISLSQLLRISLRIRASVAYCKKCTSANCLGEYLDNAMAAPVTLGGGLSNLQSDSTGS
jgi:hypothetical protein